MRLEDTWGYQRDEMIRQIEARRRANRETVARQGLLVRPLVWLYFKIRMRGIEESYEKLVKNRDGPA